MSRSSMRRAVLIAVALVLAGGVAPAAWAGNALGWTPARTYVFAVGVLEWKNKENWTSFQAKGRRDAELVAWLQKTGVPSDQVTYLQDAEATLSGIRKGLDRLLARTQPGDFLVLYYCGHGFVEEGGAYLANYDAGDTRATWLPIGEMVETIERGFHGDRAMIVIDCCHSGALVDAIGKARRKVSYAAFTSSAAHELSSGDWTFTQAVLDALRGNPLLDEDGDGRITASELARYAEDEMGTFEEQLATSLTTGTIDGQMVLAIARGERPRGRAGERVQVRHSGQWWNARILAVEGQRAKVRWLAIGFDQAADDEWVPLSTVRPLERTQHAVGTRVEVKWKGKWYPARILAIRGGVHHIHYEDYDDSWDEWVASGRIRARP